MTFPKPRRPYGIERREELAALVSIAESGGQELSSLAPAMSAIEALDRFNSTGEISDETTPRAESSLEEIPLDAITRFVTTRRSVRNFDVTRPVPDPLIQQAVQFAGTTPSVCNRRSFKAHYFDSRDTIDALLSLQNGNSGFGHTVPGLFVITEKRSAFAGPGERNQRWVDGGLFSMTLVWVLHALGLGTCFLNWSQTHARTDALREAAGIPPTEDVIVLIAVGYPSLNHRVARSPQRPVSEIFQHHR
ncbi:nitroreductase family protein [Aeromicrobium sp. zg-636]|uniref:Nitroreductase family protein n=1 Tax=Aeromicrobium senzhongii TaxID=2663859 RepID=A0A8I0EX16_9ACTN|nr:MULTISPECIES: nitroreductase family protein [Aeromicrobium]MBC9226847.1 nitroreductase family protein [Aeromicrobium senzhongii]